MVIGTCIDLCQQFAAVCQQVMSLVLALVWEAGKRLVEMESSHVSEGGFEEEGVKEREVEFRQFESLPEGTIIQIVSYLDVITLTHSTECSFRILQMCRENDWLWRRGLRLVWKDKWNPNFGIRRWWLATAEVRELPPYSTTSRRRRLLVPTPSVGTESCGLQCERQLGWYASCRASIIDSKRSEAYDAEFTALGAWFIKFRSLYPEDDNDLVHHPVAFHADGCYEDGIFFIRDAARCDWALSADTMLISTGGSHTCHRTHDWGWRVSNRFVVLSPRPPKLPLRIERCTAIGLHDRPELNGRPCVIEAFSQDTKRYHVFFPEYNTTSSCPSSASSDDDDEDDVDDVDENIDDETDEHHHYHHRQGGGRRRRRRQNKHHFTMTPPRLRPPANPMNASSSDHSALDHGPGFRLALRPANLRLPPGTRVDILTSASLFATTTGALLSPSDADDQPPLIEGKILHASLSHASSDLQPTLQYTVRLFLRLSPRENNNQATNEAPPHHSEQAAAAAGGGGLVPPKNGDRLTSFLNSLIPRPIDLLFDAEAVVAARI